MSVSKICLNMIVKNESHVITRCLDSVSPLIDTWVIVDTGSTDDTQNVIRKYFADRGIPGNLHERPWKDFGTNRTEALELARGKAEYTFIIDADEVFCVPPGYQWPTLEADCYQVLHRSGSSDTYFWLPQLFRGSLPFKYEGVLHEGLVCSAPHRVERLTGPLTHGLFDSARNQLDQVEKYSRDAAVLEEALKREPDNARYVFYLGQSYRDAKMYDKSIEAYLRRSTMGGWEEEAWYAAYQVARNLERLGRRAEAIEQYLRAFQRRPTRAEPLYELARLHRESNELQVAYLFARTAKDIVSPKDTLFVDASVYRWRCLDEWSVSAYWVGKYDECVNAARLLLSGDAVPAEQRARIQKNLDFGLAKL